MITLNPQQVEDGLGLLITQFKEKPVLAALLTSWLQQVQELEQAWLDLFTERGLDTATGAQLDVLARIVGTTRDGATDAQLLARIKSRIVINRSNGTAEDLLQIVDELGAIGANPAELVERFPAALELFLPDPLTGIDGDEVARGIYLARSAGVNALLLWTQYSGSFGVFNSEPAALGFNHGRWRNARNGAALLPTSDWTFRRGWMPDGYTTDVRCCCWVPSQGHYVSIDRHPSGRTLRSWDGINWRQLGTTILDPGNAITAANGRVVAVGGTGKVAWSTTGTSWTLAAWLTLADLYDVAFGNGVWIAVGDLDAGYSAILRSTDNGSTWTQILSAGAFEALRGICFHSASEWLAGGLNDFIALSTDGGVTWIDDPQTPTTGNGEWLSCASNGTTLIAGHSTGVISRRGSPWTEVHLAGAAVRKIRALADGTFLAVCSDGQVLLGSTDATSWQRLATLSGSLRDLAFDTSIEQTVIVGDAAVLHHRELIP